VMKGFVGEIFSSMQGEGLYAGRRQVFVRFSGCNLSCVYCDTKRFRRRVERCRVERRAGSGEFESRENPMAAGEIFKEVLRLVTPDIHSVSLTGGEPLLQAKLAAEVAKLCRRASLPVYLETNGSLPEGMRKLAGLVDYASIDVKLPEHRAVEPARWEELLERELECIKIAKKKAQVFAKIVVLPKTDEETVYPICRRLAELDVPLVIHPVTPAGGIREPPEKKLLLRLSEVAALAGVEEIAVIPQLHRIIGLR